MSVTTTSRVDATTPVLAQLVDAATKGFTGSLEVSSRDASGRTLAVSIWLEDGAICAARGRLAGPRHDCDTPVAKYSVCPINPICVGKGT